MGEGIYITCCCDGGGDDEEEMPNAQGAGDGSFQQTIGVGQRPQGELLVQRFVRNRGHRALNY